MRAARLVVLLAVIVAVTVGPAGASPARDALIRPGVGIGKIRLATPLAAVRRVLGKPPAVAERQRLGFGSEYVEYTWGAFPSWRVGVVGRPGNERVVMIATTLARERTRTSVGVGSTDTAVQRRLGARCRRATKPGLIAFSGVCFTGRKGRIQTVFSSAPPKLRVESEAGTFSGVANVLAGHGGSARLAGPGGVPFNTSFTRNRVLLFIDF